jgi:hypothetical protein
LTAQHSQHSDFEGQVRLALCDFVYVVVDLGIAHAEKSGACRDATSGLGDGTAPSEHPTRPVCNDYLRCGNGLVIAHNARAMSHKAPLSLSQANCQAAGFVIAIPP